MKARSLKVKLVMIGAIVFVASTIFTTCLTFISGVNGYVSQYYSGHQTADLFFNTADPQKAKTILDSCTDTDYVSAYKQYQGYRVSNAVTVNGNSIDPGYLYAFSFQDTKDLPWQMEVLQANGSTTAPPKGDIWISQLFADQYHVKLNDTIQLYPGHSVQLKVAAIVNNALTPSALLGIDYFYLNRDDMTQLGSFRAVNLIAVQAKASVSKTKKHLLSTVDNQVGGILLDKGTLIQSATMLSSIVGGVGLLASVLILISVLFSIAFILKSILKKEYKQLGVLKSLGRTNREVRRIYYLPFLLVNTAAVLVGCGVSVIISNTLIHIILRYIGDYTFSAIAVFVTALCFLALAAIIAVFTILVTRPVNKIIPAEAFRNTNTAAVDSKLTVVKSSSSAFAMAINDMFKYSHVSLLLVIVFCISFYLTFLFFNINYSVSRINENASKWFSTPQSDLVITGNLFSSDGKDEVLQTIQNSSDVKSYIYGDIITGANVGLNKQKYDLKSSNMSITVMNDFNSQFQFSILAGHNPEHVDEVAVGNNILRDTGLHVGDRISLLFNNQEHDMKIVGSYITLLNNGYNIKILHDTLSKYDVPANETAICVRLKNTADFDRVKQSILQTYPGVSVNAALPDISNTVSTVSDIVTPVTLILIVAILFFSLLNVVMITIITNTDQRKNFGIMKALGFSSGYIMARNLARIAVLSAAGLVFAFLFNAFFSAKLFAFALGGVDGFLNSIAGTLILSGAIIASILAAGFFSGLSVFSVSPRELFDE